MRTYFPTLPIGAGTLVRGLAVISTALTQQLKALARARRNRKTAAALAHLDGRMLKDIGLSRSEIPFIVAGKRVATPHQDNKPARAA